LNTIIAKQNKIFTLRNFRRSVNLISEFTDWCLLQISKQQSLDSPWSQV